MERNYAIITGASRGLGKCFAEKLAEKGYNLLLISLPDQGLMKAAADLERNYRVSVHFFEVDLTVKDELLMLTEKLNQFEVSILINNAGMGGSMKFKEAEVDFLNKLILLNVRATTFLTHQLLPNLERQAHAYILNVSSLAGLVPMGYKTIYPASKAFIQSFSRGLNQELKDTKVSVSVVNPGGMRTNDASSGRIDKQGFLGKFTSRSPEFVADYCLIKLMKRQEVIKVNFLSWLVLKIIPTWLSMRILTYKMKKEIE